MPRPLRIAQVAPPLERVPPRAYGGTERIVHELGTELVRRGHEVTTFASGDSEVAGVLVATVPEALRPSGYGGDPGPWMNATVAAVLDRAPGFDLIHSHLEWFSPILARAATVPVVSTFHGRLDDAWADQLLRGVPGLVAISQNQADTHPDIEWAGVVHNGLTLDGAPFDRRRTEHLMFVGRVAPEKGIVEAIDIARRADRPIRIVAKVGTLPAEIAFHETVFLPAVKAAGSLVEWIGELPGTERDLLMAESHAVLMPGSWPEPFGLVAIEALACGTPVLARRVGALPEIIREGVDGFFGDDAIQLAFLVERVGDLDRTAIRGSVLERFSAARMVDDYEAVYSRMLGEEGPGERPTGRTVASDTVVGLDALKTLRSARTTSARTA